MSGLTSKPLQHPALSLLGRHLDLIDVPPIKVQMTNPGGTALDAAGLEVEMYNGGAYYLQEDLISISFIE